MKNLRTALQLLILAGVSLHPNPLAAQLTTRTLARVPSTAAALPAPVHETSRGIFIDPLVTEHAFVDRKVRWDLAVRLLREDGAGQLFVNEYVFEYAFTRWFALEFVQPYIVSNPEASGSTAGLGDLSIGARFQLTEAARTGGVILGAGLELGLPSGQKKTGAAESYVVAPVAGIDWSIASGRFKLQSQAELEIVFPREAGDGELEAVEWNTAVSYFGSQYIVPLLELNSQFEELQGDTHTVLAVTPGVVVSLKDRAGTSFDIASGVQVFLGSDREEDLAIILSLRHHWAAQAGDRQVGPPGNR